ncbi:HNH endonuclease signature motif containing protein, partial [Microbacterium sp. SZ1]|uniref:HNH endonuclease signature motif containing protein n=1 Tax=Microbacterium sp. SZ1 TaxID=1849736 RepID=UPI00117F88E4
HAQKRHDAFAAAVGIAARHAEMPSLGGAAPTLVVTVDAKDLAANTGRARLPGSDATIPTAAAVHTACSGVIQRVVVDEGRIVGITVADRVFTVHQRRAIIARDTECLIPGCHVPAAWCEIHHVTAHAQGGPTSTDNGVPLCWWHHRSLDSSGWEIRMNNGTPQVRGPAWWDPTHHWHTPTHTTKPLHRSPTKPPHHKPHEQPQLLPVRKDPGRAAVDEVLSRTG